MKTRSSLRTLLIILTVVAIGCAMWAAKAAYDRKQEELLNKAMESIRQGNAFGHVLVQSLGGEAVGVQGDAVTAPMMKDIVAAQRIEGLVVKGPLRPEVRSILEGELEPIGQQGELTIWGRK